MLGAGLPVAAALKLASAPAQIVRLVGELLTLGAKFTVTIATLEFAGGHTPL